MDRPSLSAKVLAAAGALFQQSSYKVQPSKFAPSKSKRIVSAFGVEAFCDRAEVGRVNRTSAYAKDAVAA